jgi:ribonuclease D
MVDLMPGESVEVQGSGGNTYVIRNHDGDYSCTCLAWKRQKIPAAQRTCKHIKNLRGDQAESQRVPKARDAVSDVRLPQVFTDAAEITAAIDRLCDCGRLWLDSETADWRSGNGRLSLIQVLAEGVPPHTGEVLFLDVLDRPNLARYFTERVMADAKIEKVFHNAAFDLRHLGDEDAANVFCTLQSARSLRALQAPLPDKLTLKALAEHFGLATSISKAEQTSDWGQRPLTDRQVKYAALDVVYLRGVHLKLLDIRDSLADPATVCISTIEQQLLAMEPEYQRLKASHEYLRDLLKRSMAAQGVDGSDHFILSRSEWQPMDVSLVALSQLVMKHGLDRSISARLSRSTLASLGAIGQHLQSVSAAVERVVLRRRAKPRESV